jgi:hypothetical protein
VLPKGTGSRRALDVLRETGEAFTAPELARLILEMVEIANRRSKVLWKGDRVIYDSEPLRGASE